MYRHVYQTYSQVYAIYVSCTNTSIQYWMYIFRSYNVQTMYIHEFAGICIYVGVHTCLDHVYTMYIHCMYYFTLPWTRNTRRKILQRVGLEPTIWCITASSLHHYTSSMLEIYGIVTGHSICILLYLTRKAGDEAQDQQHPPPPGRHDVACPSINMDLFKAKVSGEAGLSETVGPKQL